MKKKNNIKKVIVATGGTGGHLFPAIEIAKQLEEKKIEVVIIADNRCKKYTNNKKITFIPSTFFHHGVTRSIISLFFIVAYALKFTFKFYFIRPNLILGFGGYASFVPLLAARFLKIPVILHEQNLIIGKVNRLFTSYAKGISFGIDIAFNLKKEHKHKSLVTNIAQNQYNKIRRPTSLKEDNLNILIFGGSQGAKVFTKIVPQSLILLQKKGINLSKIKIYQQVEKENIKIIKKQYNNIGITSDIREFFHDIKDIYNKIDLLICRGGSNSICEIIRFNIPAITIPLKCSTDKHQLFNCNYLSRKNLCWTVEQQNEKETSYKVSKIVSNLIKNKDLLIQKRNELDKLNKLRGKFPFLSEYVLSQIKNNSD